MFNRKTKDRGLTGRIFRAVCMAALAVFLASLFLILGVLYDYFNMVQWNQLRTLTEITAHSVLAEGAGFFGRIDSHDYRVTWISPDGNVLYDSISDAVSMENHLEREEIVKALESGYGESSRYSATMLEYRMYSAIRLDDGSVLRLSCEKYTISSLILGMLQPISLVIGCAIAISLYLAYHLSRNIVSPLNTLNLNEPLGNDVYEELTPLLVRIDNQQKYLKLQQDEILRKQEEFRTAVANMNEGLVLLGKMGTIITMNPSASRILSLEERHVGSCIHDLGLGDGIGSIVEDALKSRRAGVVLCIRGGYYELDASPIITDGQLTGAVLLLFDVTSRVNSENMRREFTANVSHELKTPLHSISGYAELMAKGIARQEDMQGFSEKIYTEAGRLMRLVEDILHLSRLDEGADGMEKCPVDLGEVCLSVISELMPAAELADVSLDYECDDSRGCTVEGIPQLIRGIVFNLCDNGIKYNCPGGKVSAGLTSTDTEVLLTVSDTGIGIPEEHLGRIFERFYRVDKSHSKEVGGTGLGLSIVKHAAKIHGAQLEVESVVGKGTTVAVRFPKACTLH